MDLSGIHHLTAMAADAQVNVRFYCGTLGLRLVKRTVNFDEPSAYHLYYGDAAGSPGTILTFFPWPGLARGKPGAGQVTTIGLQVAPGAVPYWRDRLRTAGVPFEERAASATGEDRLAFTDPDGLPFELTEGGPARPWRFWERGGVPEASAIRGLYGVTLTAGHAAQTRGVLGGLLGAAPIGGKDPERWRLGAGPAGAEVRVEAAAPLSAGRSGAGTVHHLAWRVPSDEAQGAWRERIVRAGLPVSPVMDRQYFHSIYFREPSGILYEIATDPPGFAVDEDPEHLGERLQLPEWLERDRAKLERALPPLEVPGGRR